MYVDGDDLTSVANHIRTKGETSAPLVFPGGFNDAIDAIETGGGDLELDSGAYLFYGGTRLGAMNELIKALKQPNSLENMFYNAKLAGVELDLSGVDGSAITSLQQMMTGSNSYNFNTVSSIKLPSGMNELIDLSSAFSYLKPVDGIALEVDLSGTNGSKITNFGYMFSSSLVETVKLPNPCGPTTGYVNWGTAFYACSKLKNIDCTPIRYISAAGQMFQGCILLEEIDLSKAQLAASTSSTFSGCTSLKRVALKPVSPNGGIGSNTFYNCSALEELILVDTSFRPALSNTNAFTNSGIAAGTGLIYVPDSLVATYQAATNWSTYASQIKGISEHPDPWWASAQA